MKQRGAKTAFKKALTLNSVWSTFHHVANQDLGIRKVSVVQTNSMAFKTERGDSWLSLTDKGADYTNPSPGCFQVYEGDTLILTYQLQISANS